MRLKRLVVGILMTGMIAVAVTGCGQDNGAIITATKTALCNGEEYQVSGGPGSPGMGDACQTELQKGKWTYSVDAQGENTATVKVFEEGSEYGSVYLSKDNNGEWHSVEKTKQ